MKEGRLVDIVFYSIENDIIIDFVYLRNEKENVVDNDKIIVFRIIFHNKHRYIYTECEVSTLKSYNTSKKSQNLDMYTDILDKICITYARGKGHIRVLTEDYIILSKTLDYDEIKFYKNLIKTITTSIRNGNIFLRKFVFDCYKSTSFPKSSDIKQEYLDNIVEKINNCKNNSYGKTIKDIFMHAALKIIESYEMIGEREHPTD